MLYLSLVDDTCFLRGRSIDCANYLARAMVRAMVRVIARVKRKGLDNFSSYTLSNFYVLTLYSEKSNLV